MCSLGKKHVTAVLCGICIPPSYRKFKHKSFVGVCEGTFFYENWVVLRGKSLKNTEACPSEGCNGNFLVGSWWCSWKVFFKGNFKCIYFHPAREGKVHWILAGKLDTGSSWKFNDIFPDLEKERKKRRIFYF
jgi:hypothetical protein